MDWSLQRLRKDCFQMPLQRGFHHLRRRLAVPGREVPGTVAAQGMRGTGSAEGVDQNLLAGSLRIAGVGTDLQSLAVAGIAAAAVAAAGH